MNHITSICFLRSDPIFHPSKLKNVKGKAVAILSPSEPMTVKGIKENRDCPKPKIYAFAIEGTDAFTELLKAKKGDFINLFGELYLDSFRTTYGEIGVRVIVKAYHVVVKPNKKMRELCERHDADAEKRISEIMNEMGMNEPQLDPIEEI